MQPWEAAEVPGPSVPSASGLTRRSFALNGLVRAWQRSCLPRGTFAVASPGCVENKNKVAQSQVVVELETLCYEAGFASHLWDRHWPDQDGG